MVPTPDLKTILDARCKKFPTAPVARKKVQTILAELKAEGLRPESLPVVIDCSANNPRWVINRTPCLTATRAATGGFYVTCVKRMCTTDELFRLQGFDPSQIITTGLSQSQLGRLIGNAFTKTVVERLLYDFLPRANIVPKDCLRCRFDA
eukprot:11186279-Lingulodinium_polyedra.AAC.1